MLAALLGLTSALSWGIGDFAGGLASRKVGAYRTVMYGEAIGLIFISAFLAGRLQNGLPQMAVGSDFFSLQNRQ